MTNRTWYLIQAPEPMFHPFKAYRGFPLTLNKGDWFTSPLNYKTLEAEFFKKGQGPIEAKNAWHPSLDDCLLDGYGTHGDIWPACQQGQKIYKTTIKLDDIMLPRFKFADPYNPGDFKEVAQGIGITGAKIKKGDTTKDISHDELIESLTGNSRKIQFKFLNKKYTDGAYESVIGFKLYLKVRGSKVPLEIDPVVRNTGGDPL